MLTFSEAEFRGPGAHNRFDPSDEDEYMDMDQRTRLLGGRGGRVMRAEAPARARRKARQFGPPFRQPREIGVPQPRGVARRMDIPARRAEPQPVATVNPVSATGIGQPSAAQRLAEVAEILAAGMLRLRRRQLGAHPGDREQVRLGFSPDRSVHAGRLRPRRTAP